MVTILLTVVGGVLLIGLAALAWHDFALRKMAKEREDAVQAMSDEEVQCFSCGMVVAKSKALEKNGRYFCGVKRNDRNGNPLPPLK